MTGSSLDHCPITAISGQDVMPRYEGVISEVHVESLLLYIERLH